MFLLAGQVSLDTVEPPPDAYEFARLNFKRLQHFDKLHVQKIAKSGDQNLVAQLAEFVSCHAGFGLTHMPA
jgi:hypothetical protein